MNVTNEEKVNILLVGGGGIGAIATLNLQNGGQASVSVVLRSNFSVVKQNGYKIESIDHGLVAPFRPDRGKDADSSS